MPTRNKAALALLTTLETRTDPDGSVWHLKLDDAHGQVWLREDGQRVRLYSRLPGSVTPKLVHEE